MCEALVRDAEIHGSGNRRRGGCERVLRVELSAMLRFKKDPSRPAAPRHSHHRSIRKVLPSERSFRAAASTRERPPARGHLNLPPPGTLTHPAPPGWAIHFLARTSSRRPWSGLRSTSPGLFFYARRRDSRSSGVRRPRSLDTESQKVHERERHTNDGNRPMMENTQKPLKIAGERRYITRPIHTAKPAQGVKPQSEAQSPILVEGPGHQS